MKILFKIALRNIFRRKLQTYLLGFIIAFTTFLLFLMVGIQTGSYKMMEDTYTKIFQGDLQIRNKDFKNIEDDFNKMISPSFVKSTEQKLNKYPETQISYSKRIISFAVAEASGKNYAFQMAGIEPENEKNVSLISKSLRKGSYLKENSNPNDIIIGQGIAEFLNLSIGSEIIIMTSDIYDSFIVDAFKVVGIFKIGDDQIDNSAFININYFYENIVYSNNFSHLAIKLNNPAKRNDLIKLLNQNLDPNLKVVPWYDILPEIKQTIEFDKISSMVFYAILIAIIGLIILNSLTLSTMKRFNEFGILSAIGLNSKHFKYLLLFENLILSFVFITIGSLLGIVALIYLSKVGIPLPETATNTNEGFDYVLLEKVIYPEIYDSFLLFGPFMVFVFCLISIIPSIIKISKLKPIEAIHNN